MCASLGRGEGEMAYRKKVQKITFLCVAHETATKGINYCAPIEIMCSFIRACLIFPPSSQSGLHKLWILNISHNAIPHKSLDPILDRPRYLCPARLKKDILLPCLPRICQLVIRLLYLLNIPRICRRPQCVRILLVIGGNMRARVTRATTI